MRSSDRDRSTAVVSFAVLGLGFLAMGLDLPWFWLIWVVGFAVGVPLVRRLRSPDPSSAPTPDDERVDAALATLRERYARGDLSEAAFEAKLERLLETETPEAARDRDRSAERQSPPDRETEPET